MNERRWDRGTFPVKITLNRLWIRFTLDFPLLLFDRPTAPVVNIVIFELLKLLLATVVCLNTSYVHIKTNQCMQNIAYHYVEKTFERAIRHKIFQKTFK